MFQSFYNSFFGRTELSADLLDACFDGDDLAVWKLLEAKADVNTKNDAGNTALQVTVLRNHTEIAKLLLSRGLSTWLCCILLILTVWEDRDVARVAVCVSDLGVQKVLAQTNVYFTKLQEPTCMPQEGIISPSTFRTLLNIT